VGPGHGPGEGAGGEGPGEGPGPGGEGPGPGAEPQHARLLPVDAGQQSPLSAAQPAQALQAGLGGDGGGGGAGAGGGGAGLDGHEQAVEPPHAWHPWPSGQYCRALAVGLQQVLLPAPHGAQSPAV